MHLRPPIGEPQWASGIMGCSRDHENTARFQRLINHDESKLAFNSTERSVFGSIVIYLGHKGNSHFRKKFATQDLLRALEMSFCANSFEKKVLSVRKISPKLIYILHFSDNLFFIGKPSENGKLNE